MFILEINKERCKSCLYCLSVCKKDVLAISGKSNKTGYHYIEVKNQENCVGCRMCAMMCPDAAIQIYKED